MAHQQGRNRLGDFHAADARWLDRREGGVITWQGADVSQVDDRNSRAYRLPQNDIVEQAQCRTQISVKPRNRLIDRTDGYMFAERLHMLEHGTVICLEGFMDIGKTGQCRSH